MCDVRVCLVLLLLVQECVEAATKFTKAREDLDTASGSLQEVGEGEGGRQREDRGEEGRRGCWCACLLSACGMGGASVWVCGCVCVLVAASRGKLRFREGGREGAGLVVHREGGRADPFAVLCLCVLVVASCLSCCTCSTRSPRGPVRSDP